MTAHAPDISSELLIAQLLEGDLRIVEEFRQLEQAQLEQILEDSALLNGATHPHSDTVPSTAEELSDVEIALAMLAVDVRVSSDATYAQALQHSDDAASTASRQFAQKLLATERKIALDIEFARRLQQLEKDGRAVGGVSDADAVLGRDEIERILAENPNEKGKGKAVVLPEDLEVRLGTGPTESDTPTESEISTDTATPQEFKPVYPMCGICLDEFQLVHSPLNATKLRPTASSTELPFGMTLGCPSEHAYCQACLVQYIQTKIHPANDGSGSVDAVVFPIRCPECPIDVWEVGVTDDVAERVLSEKGMLLWHQQRLLDSLPRIYCPNKKCSALVRTHENVDEAQAAVPCPACDTPMCIPCRAVWHENLSCEEYQALPPDERSPEDRQALQLMRAEKWRRCPECHIIIELTVGCYHITCRCGTHFCFRCGAKWDIKQGKCTRIPSCELWDEEMLLEEQERRREAAQGMQRIDQPGAVNQAVVFAQPPQLPPPPYRARPVYNDGGDLLWMMEPDAFRTRQWFTNTMIGNLTCGYCNARLRSLANLRYHLTHTRRHEVYACCGRFFRYETHFMQHTTMKVGYHEHEYRSDYY
ncbi:hypothetical protein BC629DRAFT_1596450 [Irpex lacteus]|nr:hypothetical protein BC629DRAFT_1596450 [Irpex lacteus]